MTEKTLNKIAIYILMWKEQLLTDVEAMELIRQCVLIEPAER